MAGTANAFGATVILRLLDASGREIATRFTTATCGSGCRGSWSVRVPYRLGRTSAAPSRCTRCPARDGSRQHIVTVPVVLAAAP